MAVKLLKELSGVGSVGTNDQIFVLSKTIHVFGNYIYSKRISFNNQFVPQWKQITSLLQKSS